LLRRTVLAGKAPGSLADSPARLISKPEAVAATAMVMAIGGENA
jgi:hypothetical protein